MRTLVLVSNSPRRQQLLKNNGFVFHVLSVKVSESLDKNLKLDDAIKEIARTKAGAGAEASNQLKLKDILLLSADTVVVLDDTVYGKPETLDQAKEFLRRLSGRTHQVKTSVCLWDVGTGKVVTDIETSDVTFRDLSDSEIEEYVATGEPMDKAGAYGIQGLGKKFIKTVNGNWDNVMGLSVELLKKVLRDNGWNVERKNF